ncbi:hypothetical protein SAMN04487897_11297 [Paenibacillus sp. yr247]|uniref:hypothetical protein n=1 Tax=Paenibacillus sp. yr247 TaxID=1761880 RepID=UPI000891E5D5|nr:hypothetical protein [Paenibacillus sp. yr247]SDO35131.1 hypothetical protein SAMN04487897_11297 [Paenibacillus sp. yr247]
MKNLLKTNKKTKCESPLSFDSSVTYLNDGFEWAKKQALYYVHHGEDRVGLWYEAALPRRQSFCMRDIAHQSVGASGLGLHPHTKNMLYKFAENIAESRDWCSYWEIHRDDKPTPVDYKNDHDFWYNLPANFDVIRVCYAQYLWTGDSDYLNHPVFDHFYRRSVDDYVRVWDKDGDGIIEHRPEYGRRGIASYNEVGLKPAIGGDQIAAQFAGYTAYARILQLRGDKDTAIGLLRKAHDLRELYESSWWDESNRRFYGAFLQDRRYLENYYAEGNFLPLLFGIIKNDNQRRLALADLMKNGVANVEGKTYLPDIYYLNGLKEQAYKELSELMDPGLHRREYPEVSYAVIGAIITGMMGIAGDGQGLVSTFSNLTDEVSWAKVENVPILDRNISVVHRGLIETQFTNISGESLTWKASFANEHDALVYQGDHLIPQQEIGADGLVRSYVLLSVQSGQTCTITTVV